MCVCAVVEVLPRRSLAVLVWWKPLRLIRHGATTTGRVLGIAKVVAAGKKIMDGTIAVMMGSGKEHVGVAGKTETGRTMSFTMKSGTADIGTMVAGKAHVRAVRKSRAAGSMNRKIKLLCETRGIRVIGGNVTIQAIHARLL